MLWEILDWAFYLLKASLLGVAIVIAVLWFTRDLFPVLFTPSDWE